jgi:hypothetical protein
MQLFLDEWVHSASDVYGAVDLSQRRRAQPMMSLTDISCPALTLVGALRSLEWIPIDGLVEHSDALQRNFDGRNPASSKLYFQCVLQVAALLQNNAVIASHQPQSYYRLLLSGHAVTPNLGDKHYKSLLSSTDAGQLAITFPDEPSDDGVDYDEPAEDEVDYCMPAIADVALPKATAVAVAVHKAVAPPRSFLLRPPGPRIDVDDNGDVSDSSSDSPSSVSASSSDSNVDVGGEEKWQTLPNGLKVRRDAYTPKNGAPYERWILKCSHHRKCCKKRTFAANKRFGGIEPLGYCIVWNDAGSDLVLYPDAASHIRHKPTADSVADWVIANRADFDASLF